MRNDILRGGGSFMKERNRNYELLNIPYTCTDAMIQYEDKLVDFVAKNLCRINEKNERKKNEDGTPYWHTYRSIARLGLSAMLACDFTNKDINESYP
jgi:hypothetical protein